MWINAHAQIADLRSLSEYPDPDGYSPSRETIDRAAAMARHLDSVGFMEPDVSSTVNDEVCFHWRGGDAVVELTIGEGVARIVSA